MQGTAVDADQNSNATAGAWTEANARASYNFFTSFVHLLEFVQYVNFRTYFQIKMQKLSIFEFLHKVLFFAEEITRSGKNS